MQDHDQKLITLLHNQNEEAIALLIEQYGGLIKSIIRKQLTVEDQDFEECLDDTILAIWQNIGAYDPAKNTLKHWVAAVAKYKAIDYQRKQIRQRQREQSYGELTDELFSQQDAREQADLEELLAPLSAEEQKLFRQYYANGQSSKEIAAQWNVRESWIHNKLSRGRKKIRHMLISRSEV